MPRIQTLPCPQCKSVAVYYVTLEQYNKFNNGERVQNAFPDLNADQRERFITGICSNCWNDMFSGLEE